MTPARNPATQRERTLVCDHRGSELGIAWRFLEGSEGGLEICAALRTSLRRIAAARPGLIVLDPLNARGTVELAAVDRARRGVPPVPLLVVIDRDDPDATVRVGRSIEHGLWDAVWRDAPPGEVELRIRRLRQAALQLSEMAALRHEASHDDRTDLLRPLTFQKRLFEHFSAAQRHRLELALVLVDLDKFGAINKRYDHTVGDQLITHVGEVIRRTVRTEDVAGRLGGDEFGVVLPYTGKLDAAQVVRRMREEIGKLSGRVGEASEPVEVSASIGFETFDGGDLESVASLRRNAERALRAAKERGGDQVVYFRNL